MNIQGLNELIRSLDESSENYEKEARKALNQIGMRLKAKVMSKTPTDTGVLQKSWRYRTIDKNKGILFNNVHYASYVEYGFRTRQGKGKSKGYKPKEGGKSFIDGRYMLTKSVKEIESELDNQLSTLIENLWK